MQGHQHHYISQCYLKGFTKAGSKKSQLTVVDFKEKKCFETIPRNVGGIRDFNRIDIAGKNPNIIEQSLASFEGRIASALQNLERDLSFDGSTKDLILFLIALIAVRSPEMREHLKKFHQKKAYTIKVSKEYHIYMEFAQIEALLPYLAGRNWLIILATNDSGPFITTDNPVNLTWKNPEKIQPFYRNSPGYGMKDTQVYFPVSKNLALVGEFDGRNGVMMEQGNL
jgi:hypothetical protein